MDKAPDSSGYSSQLRSSLPGITYRSVSLLLCFSQFPTELFFKVFIGIQLTSDALLVSGIQQSESAIHLHRSTLFKILFPYRSLQSIE